MKYRFVQCINGQLIATEFTEDNIVPAMEVRGYEFHGLNENPCHRVELQGQPTFTRLLGPMWDGDAIRYEDVATYKLLSV